MNDLAGAHGRVRRLALPAIGISLLQTAVLVVDRAMLGHHAETSLAAMQVAGILEWSLWSVFSAFEVATIARVGWHVGGKNRAGARMVTLLSLAVALVTGLALTALTPLVIAPGHLGQVFTGASPASLTEAAAYLRYALGASPVVFVALGTAVSLQASGDSRTPLLIGLVSNLVHIALNYVLIGGAFGIAARGAEGAGMSTAFTFVLEAAAGIVALTSRRRPVCLLPDPRSTDVLDVRSEARTLFRIAVPAVTERALYHLGFLGFVLLIVALGDVAMAANQAILGLEAICYNSSEGFGIAAAALVAQDLGAQRPADARRASRIAHLDAVVALSIAGLLAWCGRSLLIPVFTADPVTIALGCAAMPLLALAQPFMATGIVLSQSLRGAGRTRAALLVSFVGAVGVRLSATWLFAFHLRLGLVGVWIGSTCDWITRSAVLALLLKLKPLGSEPRP